MSRQTLDAPVGREEIEFTAEGDLIRGTLYKPGRPGPHPAVVMVHGFSATANRMVADCYAAAFAEHGIAALLIDPRSFGRSEGLPRCEINVWQQARDYRAAVDYLLDRSGDIDRDRIAVWGDSLSGKVALVVAAVDPRLAAIVVQVPGCGAEVIEPAPARYESIRGTVLHADLDKFQRTIEGPAPVVSFDQAGSPSLLTPITAYRWFLTYGAQFGTGWENRATVAVLDTPTPFEVFSCMAHLSAPLLMVVAEEDEMPGADADVARHAFSLAPNPKELVQIGGGHFGLLYEDSPEFEVSVGAQTEFLVRHLL